MDAGAAARTNTHSKQMFTETETERWRDEAKEEIRGEEVGQRDGEWRFAKSQICASLRCFPFVSSSTFPPSSISCGDLSFPAGPMLISYWSSGFRVSVSEMGKGGARRGCCSEGGI